MPHLQIQYSKNLAERADMDAFCQTMVHEIVAIGLFPKGGIRVRAFAADYCTLADTHPENAFLDMFFRIGQGRSETEKKDSGERIMKCARNFFAPEFENEHFMLSLEIVEINHDYSWKANVIHKRLEREKA